MNFIEISDLTKSYGDNQVFNSISTRITSDHGAIIGLVGANGAGKSTLMKIIARIDGEYSGNCNIQINGEWINSKFDVGFLPEERSLPKSGDVERILYLWTRLRGYSGKKTQELVEYWLDRLGLREYQKTKLSALSKGYKQKLQLACCLLHDPLLVIFDEPFSGLDPINQELVVDLLKERKRAGAIVLVSAHQLELIERINDQLFIVRDGNVMKIEPPGSEVPNKRFHIAGSRSAALDTISNQLSIDDSGEIDTRNLPTGVKAALFDAFVNDEIVVRSTQTASLRAQYIKTSETKGATE